MDLAPPPPPTRAAAASWSDNGLYLTGEDNLRLTCISALAGNVVIVEGRLVT
jgi:hypothetical protein